MRFLTESLFTRFTISSIANLVLTTDGFLQAHMDKTSLHVYQPYSNERKGGLVYSSAS